MEIGGNQAVAAAREVRPDDWSMAHQPVRRIKRNQAEHHVDGVVAEAHVAARGYLHHGTRQPQIVRMKIAIRAIERRRESIEWNSSDAWIGQASGEPVLQIDKTQDA